jgi:hypothetical protein
MIAELISKVAGFEKKARSHYIPRPSSAGPERCIRQMVYHATNTPQDKEIGDRFVLTMDDSSWHEELTGDWINKTAYKLHSQQMAIDILELPFHPDTKNKTRYCDMCKKLIPANVLHGHIDGILVDMLETEYLYEHKALNHFTFERYWKGAWPLDHITQSVSYVFGLSKISSSIKKAVLVIKNKNTAQYIDMVIHYDAEKDCAYVYEVTHSNGEVRSNGDGSPLLIIENIISDVVDKFKTVNEHKINKTLPARPFELGQSFRCDYCQWNVKCWSGYKEEIDKLSTDVSLDGEIVDLCKYKLEISTHMKEMKKEHDEMTDRIKMLLKDKKVKEGSAGEYVLKLSVQERTKLNKDVIPIDILNEAEEKYFIEMLTVRKPKPKKK